MSFPPSFLEEIRSRLSLSEVIGQRIKLTRAGREFKGCCPFHNEKTASFTVNETKGFFHCFGCGAHGDVISFVMQNDRLSFHETIEILANKAGLDVPQFSPQEVAKAQQQKTLHQICETAAQWFEQQLHSTAGRAALAYAQSRGLKENDLHRFRLGYAPLDGQALIQHLKGLGFETALMIEAGIARQRESDGQTYAFFRDRLMFPVADRRGRVVAFGGRLISGDGPKYINSPDHPLFHKGKLLYNLSRAREAAPRGAPVIVVEGYMDVIALVKNGFEAAVAPLGTALTEEQMEELWRLGASEGDPILCFDGDSAGQRAAERALLRALPLLSAGKTFRFAFLPHGQDPDDLLKSAGIAGMNEALKTAIPLVDMLWRLESGRRPLNTPEAQAGLKKALEDQIKLMADATVQKFYRAAFGRRLDEQFQKPAQAYKNTNYNNKLSKFNRAIPPSPPPPLPHPQIIWQRQCLLALLRYPQLFDEVGVQLVTLELKGPLDKLWQAVVTNIENQPSLDSSGLRERLRDLGWDDPLKSILAQGVEARAWLKEGETIDDVRAGLQDIIALHHRHATQATFRQMAQQYEQQTDDEMRRRISAMRQELNHDHDER